ncbi:MAG TPA: outer membrane beta-barrel protein [Puia sp.]
MDHLENDMDDLFQKAGELYPLKTTESDWDAVLGKLNEEGFGDHSAVVGINAKGNRNKRIWFFLLLLIPLGLGSIIYFSPSKNQRSTASSPVTVKNNITKEPNAALNKTGIHTEQPKVDLNNQTVVNKSAIQKESYNRKKEAQSSYTISRNNLNKTAKHSTKGDTEILMSAGDHKNKNDTRSKIENPSPVEGELVKANLALSEASEYSQKSFQQALAIKPLSLSVSGPNEIVSVEGKPLHSSVSGLLNDQSSVTNSKPIKNLSNKGFYVDFLAGPDLSTVKFQSVKQLGFSLGVLAGYRFNKRFSIETGLLWDKKYYYSNGEYFNKSKTNIPDTVNILNVDGNCNMFEIPISLRYDFASKNNHGFFVKAGLSSYLMKKENYAIQAEVNGHIYPPYPYSNNYNLTNNIFSILQLSGGYEHAISGKTNIWIEPYLKIPIQGIGIGNMPITSAGFYIGISYSFR